MRFTNLLVTLAGFSTLSSAWIDSFLVNQSTKPGDDVTLILEGHNYIQAVGEVAAVFGLAPDNSEGSEIATVLGKVLTAEHSNKLGNFTYHATVPKDTKESKYVFRVGLFGTYGAGNTPTSIVREADVIIGDKTSSSLVQSKIVS